MARIGISAFGVPSGKFAVSCIWRVARTRAPNELVNLRTFAAGGLPSTVKGIGGSGGAEVATCSCFVARTRAPNDEVIRSGREDLEGGGATADAHASTPLGCLVVLIESAFERSKRPLVRPAARAGAGARGRTLAAVDG